MSGMSTDLLLHILVKIGYRSDEKKLSKVGCGGNVILVAEAL